MADMRSTVLLAKRPRHRLAAGPLQICMVGAMVAGTFVVASHWSQVGVSAPNKQEVPGITIEAIHIGKTGKQEAVVVTSVQSNGPAHDLGIRVGDVIELVDGQPVATRRQLSNIIASHSAADVHFGLMRGTAPVEVDLPLPPSSAKPA